MDGVLLTLALVLATFARGMLPFGDELGGHMVVVGPLLVLVWLGLLWGFGSYQLRHQRAGVIEYKRVVMASFTMAGTVGITSYLLKAEFPRGLFVLLFSAGTVALIVSRFARRQLMHAIHRRGALLTPVAVAGDAGHVDAIAKVLRRESWLGYRVVGAVTGDRSAATPGGLPILGSTAETVAVIEEHDIATVIFAEGSFATPADFRRMAWELEEKDIQMIMVPTLTDVSAQRLDVRPVAGLPLVDVDRPQAIEAARWIKRVWDVVGSAVILLLAAPVMGLVALAIKLEDGGPVMFRQRRVGLKGEEFDCLKFRSMCTDAEARLAALMAQNEGAGPLFKMTHDPRITRVGRFIRRFSLDELPQLWNALRGDMSLVGPRPALPAEVAQYDSDTRRRLDVRPGLTGLWQVSGRSNLSWDDTVRLDLYYVDNWSMVQDLMILAKTARAVVGSSGAY
ncbi:MAG: sugar transferase [Propionicimonas sp.]|uniref:sugar transferase n=1 Tax=Propionicimonas sp. TaxID=1955623 RepID=UPI003D0B8CE3